MTTQTPSMQINGIEVEALQRTIESIKKDASLAATRWKVKSRWVDGTRTDHDVNSVEIGGEEVYRQFQIQIDEPHELCGSNQFANPQEYLLAATNACMMVGYSAVAALMGITLSKLELEITGDIDLRGFLGIDQDIAPGYESLHYLVRISGDGTPDQLRQLHQTVQRTSPNYHNISQPIALTCDLVID